MFAFGLCFYSSSPHSWKQGPSRTPRGSAGSLQEKTQNLLQPEWIQSHMAEGKEETGTITSRCEKAAGVLRSIRHHLVCSSQPRGQALAVRAEAPELCVQRPQSCAEQPKNSLGCGGAVTRPQGGLALLLKI